MNSRVTTKIGDIFSVQINEECRKYFQLVARDLTQLNSDVIRAFSKVYSNKANPELNEIVKEKPEFYAHCVTKLGLKMGYWQKVGNVAEIGVTNNILFRDTNDYGTIKGGKPVSISNQWYIWHINDKNFTRVGKLEGENRNSYIGIVINPLGIIKLLKGEKYPINYPDF